MSRWAPKGRDLWKPQISYTSLQYLQLCNLYSFYYSFSPFAIFLRAVLCLFVFFLSVFAIDFKLLPVNFVSLIVLSVFVAV